MSTYIRPSQCDRCVPIETITAHTFAHWTTDIAHEPTCPNRKDPTQ